MATPSACNRLAELWARVPNAPESRPTRNAIIDVTELALAGPLALQAALNQLSGAVCDGIVAPRWPTFALLRVQTELRFSLPDAEAPTLTRCGNFPTVRSASAGIGYAPLETH